ncbi:hypothetical protein LPJ66_009435, partial [Kickxella alabastrina]
TTKYCLYGAADNGDKNDDNADNVDDDRDDGDKANGDRDDGDDEDDNDGDDNDDDCTSSKLAVASVVEPTAQSATTTTDTTKPAACENPAATVDSTSESPMEQLPTPTPSCESLPTHSSERLPPPALNINIVVNKYIVNGSSKRKRQPNENGTLDTAPRVRKLRKGVYNACWNVDIRCLLT